MKVLENLVILKIYFNIKQKTHDEHHAKWRKAHGTSSNSRIKQGCLFSPFLVDIVLEFLAGAIRQGLKGVINNKAVKMSSFTDDTILYTKGPKDFTRKLLQLTNISCRVAG